MPGQVQHCNRLAPKSSGHCFAHGNTASSIHNSWPFSSWAVCGMRYSDRVSVSSRMRPIKQNQNQNPKTNSKKKVAKKSKKSEALSPPSRKYLFWSLCLLFLMWQVLQMPSPHPASLQWLMCYGLSESLKSSPFGPPHLIKKWSLAINNSLGWVFV